jgi:hypothetical protein
MRALVLTAALFAAGPAAAAGPEVTFAERAALLGADRACDLFTPQLRAALQAAAAQARGALLRSGWSEARADRLGADARAEGAGRACTDPVLVRAAEQARHGFAGWTRLPTMRFAGGERSWTARRAQDIDKFYLRQDIPAPRAAAFGLREDGRRATVTLRVPLAANEPAPGVARLYFRDRARAPRSAADLPGRTRTGLDALAASRATATVVFAQTRHVETGERGRAAVFTFADAVLATLAALDPREAVEIELDGPGGLQRLYLEVGDLAAARAFLAAQPMS